eukprot:TRINITY_DN6319_c0_g1_i2.p1 TRINITY_DN6319_c0_g1~~TRINITY_DN6319_c0_g1_i2.p1  ORF type:complete len:422 (+),score=57.62 TRINITY_DN6319_c0_g1_i2:142-1407(+)
MSSYRHADPAPTGTEGLAALRELVHLVAKPLAGELAAEPSEVTEKLARSVSADIVIQTQVVEDARRRLLEAERELQRMVHVRRACEQILFPSKRVRTAQPLVGDQTVSLPPSTQSLTYYNHDRGTFYEPRLPSAIDPAVFGGVFTVGAYVNRGQFGAVFRLVKQCDFKDDTNFMLKVSNERIDLPPYMLRKDIGNDTFLYIMEEAIEEDRAITLLYNAVPELWTLHVIEGRAHGDVQLSNLRSASDGPFGYRESRPFRILIDELGWEPVSKGSVDYYLIDPDLSIGLRKPKRIVNILHEDPRNPRASEMDDLIGLLNAVLLHNEVKIGGFEHDEHCDFKYGCPLDAVEEVWQCICSCYCKRLDVVRAWAAFLGAFDKLRDSRGHGESLMSVAVECAEPGENAYKEAGYSEDDSSDSEASDS